jgi:hypothetical protein
LGFQSYLLLLFQLLFIQLLHQMAKKTELTKKDNLLKLASKAKVKRTTYKGGVKVEVKDANDPVPYWLISSKHAEKLVSAINKL